MEIDLEIIKSWVGKSDAWSGLIDATWMQGLIAVLDRDGPALRAGDPVPLCAHWLYWFTPIARQSMLGPDGHARRGDFLPPVPLPRRMWAGSAIEFHAPLCVGDAVERRSTIVDIAGKEGRTGYLVLVRIRHELHSNRGLALVDEQGIVYRDNPKSGEALPTAERAPAEHDYERTIEPNPTLLFRYSALMHNAHRIHYDRPYVMEVERYPGLVVQGPLVGTLLLDLLRRNRPDAQVRSFTVRGVKPLFDNAPFLVCGRHEADGKAVQLWAQDAEGALAMRATAVLQ